MTPTSTVRMDLLLGIGVDCEYYATGICPEDGNLGV